jgi:hypothetical protein
MEKLVSAEDGLSENMGDYFHKRGSNKILLSAEPILGIADIDEPKTVKLESM